MSTAHEDRDKVLSLVFRMLIAAGLPERRAQEICDEINSYHEDDGSALDDFAAPPNLEFF